MKISVIVPFFNRNEQLRGALTSIVKQTRPAHEIIVADDCSVEDISWVATEFPMVKVIRLEKNLHSAGARYTAAQVATGTHIASLDADDFWYPEKLERQVAYAEKISDPRGIYTHQQYVDEGTSGTIRPVDGPREGEPASEYMYVRGGFIQSNTFLIERSLYLEICLVSREDSLYADDWEIVMRAEPLKCPIYLLKEVLSQWNCGDDPQRSSNGKVFGQTTFTRDFLPRQATYFTPKAQAAFGGRWLAPRLMNQGQYGDAAHLLGRAIQARALSPMAAAKIVLRTAFPNQFMHAATLYSNLRTKKKSGSPAPTH